MSVSWKGRGNQYIQFIRVLYCKLPTTSKQLPAVPLEAVLGIPPPPASEVGGESVTTRHWGPIRINNVSINSVPRCSELLLVSKIPHECKNLGFLKGKGGCSLQV